MKIKLLTRAASAAWAGKPGDIVDIDPEEATQIVNGGYATCEEPITEAQEAPTEEPPKTPEMKQPQKTATKQTKPKNKK